MGSGLSLTPRGLAKLAQHTLKAFGQFNIANRPQCIDDDVEFGRTDNQVETIAIDIEERLRTLIARIFGWHGGRELSPRAMRAKLSGCQVAVAIRRSERAARPQRQRGSGHRTGATSADLPITKATSLKNTIVGGVPSSRQRRR